MVSWGQSYIEREGTPGEVQFKNTSINCGWPISSDFTLKSLHCSLHLRTCYKMSHKLGLAGELAFILFSLKWLRQDIAGLDRNIENILRSYRLLPAAHSPGVLLWIDHTFECRVFFTGWIAFKHVKQSVMYQLCTLHPMCSFHPLNHSVVYWTLGPGERLASSMDTV